MKAFGTLSQMIAIALQISPNVAADMLIGIPKSADATHWDITAKVPSTGEGAPNALSAGDPCHRRSASVWRCCAACCWISSN